MTDETPPEKTLAQAVARIARADYPAWQAALASAGYCTRPVRLIGHYTRTDPATGEITQRYTTASEPGGVLLKACNNRRATRCPACAAIYQADARALILAGLLGGKGQPEQLATHPVIFATLTAPSYGPVHTTHHPGPCHPHPVCPHRRTCHTVHPPGDPLVGTPICQDCYDWAGTVIFNATATELWRRTTITTRRTLAGLLNLPVRHIDAHHNLAYVKVVEYQTRGVIRYHALLRADPTPGNQPLDPDLLATAFRLAVARTTAPNPHQPDKPIRWGQQNDVAVVPTGPDRARLAGYLAKYTTKSVDTAGGLDHRLTHQPDPDTTNIPDHLLRLAQTAWTLADHPALKNLHLRYWSHTLGYRGHWLTKSPTWSTTLTTIRQNRHTHQLTTHGHNPTHHIQAEWEYHGNGHTTTGDTWLAHHAHNNHQHQKHLAWEEQ